MFRGTFTCLGTWRLIVSVGIGSAAAGRASILQAIAIVLGLCAVGLLAVTWRLLSLLGAHAA